MRRAGRALRRSDAGVSSVVGAILILAILGMSLVYVNAFHVPRQGATMEMAGREDAEAALALLAADLAAPARGSLTADLPLRPDAPGPPLLAGVVLSPARAHGRLSFEPAQTNVSVSHVTAAPAGGVPVGDPIRAALPGGLMRVWSLGNATGGVPVGSLRLAPGAAYLEGASYAVEAGAVVVKREDGSALVAPPALHVGAAGGVTTVSWRVPLLRGAAAEVGGGERAQVGLAPGPESASGGGQRVHEVSIRVDTDALQAWRTALEELVGGRGSVAVAQTGPDRGVVTATIAAPPGTPAGTPAVELDLKAVRYAVGLAERGSG